MWKALHSFLGKVTHNSHRLAVPTDEGSSAPLVIVALVLDERDREILASVAARNQWVLKFADTCGQAWSGLNRLKAPIILCDRRLPGVDWRDMVYMMASSSHRACAILLSNVADDYLWNEVNRVGGFDVLSAPLREDDLVRSVRMAWRYWNTARPRK